jgi:hypothetical protein
MMIIIIIIIIIVRALVARGRVSACAPPMRRVSGYSVCVFMFAHQYTREQSSCGLCSKAFYGEQKIIKSQLSTDQRGGV